jgi:aspartyl-tRNA(Asn)/glutamyl-tRNA(Gln) amidotransferase subunit B
MMGDLLRELKRDEKEIDQSLLTPSHLAEMLSMIKEGTISGKIAKGVFEDIYRTGKSPSSIVEEKGLIQLTDRQSIEKVVKEVVANNPEQARQYRSGKDKLLGFFIGQVMKETGGKANPGLVNTILKEVLSK